MIWLKSFSF